MQTVLVPLDGSDLAELALPHAVALVRRLGGRIVLARVPETLVVPVMSGGIWVTREVESHEAQEVAEAYLAEIAAREALAGLDVETLTPHHPVAHGLLEAIHHSAAGLVVMTTHGHSGLGRWLLGSVADKLVHASPVPVYVVRSSESPAPPAFGRVLVPLDGSELAEAALEDAAALAQVAGSELRLVRVPTLPGYATAIPETAGWIPDLLREAALEAETYLTGIAARLEAEGLRVAADVEMIVAGSVADALLDYAERSRVDLIVMSTHGRTGVGRWLFGSVADRVLQASPVPVWLVRVAEGPDAA